jgi:hypothetical protein
LYLRGSRIQDHFRDQMKVPVSVGTLCNINRHAYELLARFDAIAVNQLAASALLHADETGINIARARRGARLPDHVPATPGGGAQRMPAA